MAFSKFPLHMSLARGLSKLKSCGQDLISVFHLVPLLFTGALDKQRQMYEEKIEELRNQMVPVGRQAMERTSSIGSFSSGYGSSRMSWCEDRLVTV